MTLETVGALTDYAEGKDIVWPAWQHAEVHWRTGKALRPLLNKARAMASYGICAGILGALRTQGVPLYELTPTEVKLAAGQKKDASKKQMIAWATQLHPEAKWPTYKSNGKVVLSEAKAEHQADAVAAIYAGIASNSFQQLLSLQTANQRENHHADPTQAI